MSSAERGGIQRRQTFHFINSRPSSESERRQTLHFIRSHVGSWAKQFIKQNSVKSEAEEVDESYVQHINSSGGADWNSLDGEAAEFPSSSASPSTDSQNSDSATDNTTPSSCDVSGQTLIRPYKTAKRSASAPSCLSHPLNSVDCVSAGFLDPFQTYPSGFPSEFVNWGINYCVSVVWPSLMPSSSPGRRSEGVVGWLEYAWQDPTLFMLVLYCAICHQRMQWLIKGKPTGVFEPPFKQMLAISELESIKEVKNAIQNPSRAISDGVILSVACLANYRGDELLWDSNIQSPFQPPLQDLQWLDVYGSLSPNFLHLNGLAQLLKLREGPEKIMLAGLASILSYSDILAASKTLSSPQLPFIPLRGDLNPTLQQQLGFGPTELKDGFMRLCDIGFTTELAEVYQAMKTYISMVKRYEEGAIIDRYMCDHRNIVQYHLLSLPPAKDFDRNFRQTHPVYEACRLAGLIFGVGVIFPLSVRTAPFQCLVRQLQAELQSSNVESRWRSRDSIGVLFWVLTLGGIAATGYPERTWFVATLGRVISCSGLSSWQDLKQVLELMPWLDSACGNGAQQLWGELENSISLVLR